MKPQTFALITASVVGGTGVLGTIKALNWGTNDHLDEMREFEGYGKIGGVVPTNSLFNLLRMGIGVAGILASNDEKSAVMFNRAVAISYAGMGILGLIPATDTLFGLMPIYGANVGLHLGTAATELLTEPEVLEKSKTALANTYAKSSEIETRMAKSAKKLVKKVSGKKAPVSKRVAAGKTSANRSAKRA